MYVTLYLMELLDGAYEVLYVIKTVILFYFIFVDECIGKFRMSDVERYERRRRKKKKYGT